MDSPSWCCLRLLPGRERRVRIVPVVWFPSRMLFVPDLRFRLNRFLRSICHNSNSDHGSIMLGLHDSIFDTGHSCGFKCGCVSVV